jgi:hypothetical protein
MCTVVSEQMRNLWCFLGPSPHAHIYLTLSLSICDCVDFYFYQLVHFSNHMNFLDHQFCDVPLNLHGQKVTLCADTVIASCYTFMLVSTFFAV